MNTSTQSPRPEAHQLVLYGEAGKLFGIMILNALLTFVTLGLYYPWAKAAVRRYLWEEVDLNEENFVFHGTGQEIFKGFLMAYAILAVTLVATLLFPLLALLFPFLLLLIFAFAIFGAWRYRLSRTSRSGIFFSFDGNFRSFLGLFVTHGFLTILTLGIYGSWFRVKIQQYLLSHTKFGHLRFDFHGTGSDLFVINLLGAVLFYPTIGIYVPWYLKNRFNFWVNHTSLSDDEGTYYLESSLTGSEAASVLIPNFFVLFCTIGLAYPWTMLRRLRMQLNHIILPPEIDFETLRPEADHFDDASGDAMLDILDVGFDI